MQLTKNGTSNTHHSVRFAEENNAHADDAQSGTSKVQKAISPPVDGRTDEGAQGDLRDVAPEYLTCDMPTEP